MSTDSFGGLAGVRQRVKPCQRATSALVHQGNHRQSISLSGQQCDRHTFTRKPVILSRGVIILPTYLPNTNFLSLTVQKAKMSLSSAAAKSLRSAHDDENLGDDLSQGGSSRGSSKALSVTDWTGDDAPPDFALFEERHCRCIFKYKGAKGKPYSLVCGNLASDCRREGHSATTMSSKGLVGIYKVDVYRKHQLNGILNSYMTEAEFNRKDEEERARMRKYTIELGSGLFDITSPVEEVKFKPSVPGPSFFGDADEPFDQKLSAASKSVPQVSWKPRIPDISIPVPKQQSGASTPPASGKQASQVNQDDLQQVVIAMADALQKMSTRMSSMEQDAGRLQQDLQTGQAQTNTVLSGLEKAMVALAEAQAASVSRPSVPSPTGGYSGGAFASTSTGAGGGSSSTVPVTSLPTPSAGLDVSGHFHDRDLLPPVRLLGDDRNKEKDELFNVRLRGEAQLKKDLSPLNANSTTRDDLAANMIDVVSLPGTFSGSDETAGYDGTHQVAEVMREVMAQARGEAPGERVRVDSGWQHSRRISLHAIKSADQLQEQYGNLTDIAEEVLSHFVQSTLSILQAGHYTDYVAEQWSQNGFYARIVRDSLRFYMDLHLHLLNICLAKGWEQANLDLKYHGNKLWMIRAPAGNRLVCLCKTYCYLRNGKKNSWVNDDLLSKRMDFLQKTIAKAGGGPRIPKNEGKPVVNETLCRKCRSNCHSLDIPCPWKNLKDADARKAAAAWMANPVSPPQP